MLAPVETIASTMLLRIMSTKTFFRPALMSEPARQRMTPHSFVAEHAVVDVGGAAEVAGREGHLAHRFNQRHDVVLLDVDVLDDFDKQIGFFRFHMAFGSDLELRGQKALCHPERSEEPRKILVALLP